MLKVCILIILASFLQIIEPTQKHAYILFLYFKINSNQTIDTIPIEHFKNNY